MSFSSYNSSFNSDNNFFSIEGNYENKNTDFNNYNNDYNIDKLLLYQYIVKKNNKNIKAPICNVNIEKTNIFKLIKNSISYVCD